MSADSREEDPWAGSSVERGSYAALSAGCSWCIQPMCSRPPARWRRRHVLLIPSRLLPSTWLLWAVALAMTAVICLLDDYYLIHLLSCCLLSTSTVFCYFWSLDVHILGRLPRRRLCLLEMFEFSHHEILLTYWQLVFVLLIWQRMTLRTGQRRQQTLINTTSR